MFSSSCFSRALRNTLNAFNAFLPILGGVPCASSVDSSCAFPTFSEPTSPSVEPSGSLDVSFDDSELDSEFVSAGLTMLFVVDIPSKVASIFHVPSCPCSTSELPRTRLILVLSAFIL